MDRLISLLLAIQNFNKDIHYSCAGKNFYSDHLLVDKFSFDYIDDLKEVCLLGKGIAPKDSKSYLENAIDLIPVKSLDTNTNFTLLQKLVGDTLVHIETLDGLSKADENLIGAIAQDLQQYYGLLNLRIEND